MQVSLLSKHFVLTYWATFFPGEDKDIMTIGERTNQQTLFYMLLRKKRVIGIWITHWYAGLRLKGMYPTGIGLKRLSWKVRQFLIFLKWVQILQKQLNEYIILYFITGLCFQVMRDASERFAHCCWQGDKQEGNGPIAMSIFTAPERSRIPPHISFQNDDITNHPGL